MLSAVGVAWLVGQGLFGLPFYIIIFLALGLAVALRPDWGILGLVLFLAGGADYLPKSGYGEELGVAGLNALTITQFAVWALWLLSYLIRRDHWKPSGWFGKVMLLFAAYVVFGILVNVVRSGVFRLDSWILAGVQARPRLAIPITAVMILQTRFSRKSILLTLYALIIFNVIGFGFALNTIYEYGASYERIRQVIGKTPGDVTTSVFTFSVATGMILLSRGASRKLLWFAAIAIGLYPFSVYQNRAVYLAAGVALVLTVMFLSRGNSRLRVGALVLIGGFGTVLAYTVADTIVARLVHTFYTPTGERWIDPSVYIRFHYYSIAWQALTDDPSLLLFGGTDIMRRYANYNRSFHNYWISALLGGGLPSVILSILLYVGQYKVLRIFVEAKEPKIVRAFGAGLAASIVGAQIMLFTHSPSLTGPFFISLWCVSALLLTQLRKGGMYEYLKTADGRYAAEAMGIRSAEDIERSLREAGQTWEQGEATDPVEQRGNAPGAFPAPGF